VAAQPHCAAARRSAARRASRGAHHPETGRKALFVSEHFTTRIVGIPEDESRALLDELFARSTRPELQYRHVWRPHDMVFWDNRSVTHLAAGTPAHLRRKLYRTTVEGDVPF